MFARVITWLKDTWRYGFPAHKANKKLPTAWERRGYKNEAEYRAYLLASVKLTESDIELRPNFVYSADHQTWTPVGRYYPGVARIPPEITEE